jgi:hypothetical protein
VKATTMEEWKKKKERTKVKAFMMNKEVLFAINLFKGV